MAIIFIHLDHIDPIADEAVAGFYFNGPSATTSGPYLPPLKILRRGSA
jgi:hypothetical protein